jgi:hypothetical protein
MVTAVSARAVIAVGTEAVRPGIRGHSALTRLVYACFPAQHQRAVIALPVAGHQAPVWRGDNSHIRRELGIRYT